MGFSRARTNEQKQQRIKDVINATASLYDSLPYDEVTFAAIAKKTGFARSNLYIYFTSKEEILLELLSNDFVSWYEDLAVSFHERRAYTLEEIATIWTDSLNKNKRMLSLLSILFTVLEKNVSIESLAKFKEKLATIQEQSYHLLRGLFPKASDEDLQQFSVSQLALAQGMYPMTQLTEHQKKAIKISGYEYEPPHFQDIYHPSVLKLLQGLDA